MEINTCKQFIVQEVSEIYKIEAYCCIEAEKRWSIEGQYIDKTIKFCPFCGEAITFMDSGSVFLDTKKN